MAKVYVTAGDCYPFYTIANKPYGLPVKLTDQELITITRAFKAFDKAQGLLHERYFSAENEPCKKPTRRKAK